MLHDAATGTIPQLAALLKQRIAMQGPLTFADFMDIALYHPNFGYYTRTMRQIGPTGDYLTAPEVHPAFGRLLGRWAQERWQALGWPPRFAVIEGGPGTGALARGVFEWADGQPDFLAALEYVLVEKSGPLANRQRRTLGPYASRCRWTESLASEPSGGATGCFLSNELFDALPVHRVVNEDGRLREIYVVWDREDFHEEIGEPSTPMVAEYLADAGVVLPAGRRFTVCLAANEMVRDIARVLRAGWVLTIDYGGTSEELLAREDDGLVCFARHTVNADPYRDIGNQDIMARVNFTALQRFGERMLLRTEAYTTQREFLEALGLREVVASLDELPLSRREAWGHRKALLQLAEAGQFGEMRVLVQRRG